MKPLPNAICPVCGLANGCAPAREGRFDVPCWCTSVRIGPEALAKVPVDRASLACLCPRCATGFDEHAS